MNYVLGCLEYCCNDHQMQKIWAVSGKGCHGSHNSPCWHKIQDYFRGNWTAIIRNDYYYRGKQNRSLYQRLLYHKVPLYGRTLWKYNCLGIQSLGVKQYWTKKRLIQFNLGLMCIVFLSKIIFFRRHRLHCVQIFSPKGKMSINCNNSTTYWVIFFSEIGQQPSKEETRKGTS